MPMNNRSMGEVGKSGRVSRICRVRFGSIEVVWDESMGFMGNVTRYGMRNANKKKNEEGLVSWLLFSSTRSILRHGRVLPPLDWIKRVWMNLRC